MGWAFWSADHVSNPTLGVHPLARSRCQGLVLGIVNPDATSSGRFGTIPCIGLAAAPAPYTRVGVGCALDSFHTRWGRGKTYAPYLDCHRFHYCIGLTGVMIRGGGD